MNAQPHPFPNPARLAVTRRGLLGASAVGAAGLGLGLSPYGISPAHAAPAGLGLSAEVVDLGIAAVERNVRTGAAGITRKGIPLLYLLSDGNPVSFNVLNGDTGELIGSFPLPPKSVGSYPTVTPDGTAYFAVRDG